MIIKEQILKLSKKGKKVKEIASQLNIWESQVRYWLNEEYRKKSIQDSINRKKSMSKEQREKYNESRREYNRNYQVKRYAEDEVFREKKKTQARLRSKNATG